MIYGVVAEFNPFHNGHSHLIQSLKQGGENSVVAIMSGNFVQRGEPAIISKFARAKMAVDSGVDLVLELPLPYSISTAMYFAGGAIDTLNSLGVVDTLAFGSECGDLEKLQNVVDLLENSDLKTALKWELKKGVTFAVARTEALKHLDPNTDLSVLTSPNDTLGIEYISAARRFNATFNFKVTKRLGAGHDSVETTDNICSASLLREKPINLFKCSGFMPESSYAVFENEIKSGKYADINYLERSIIAHLRTTSAEILKEVPDVSEGLENKIIISANNYSNLTDILSAVKSKRYTLARLRRIILASYLGITADLQKEKIPYIKILAMNERGAEILSKAKQKAKVPIVSSVKEAENIGIKADKFISLEVLAGDIYSLCLKNPAPGKTDYTTRLYKLFNR